MRPLIIAHRGASGYLPEHTLEAKRLAHEMGADYLEQDVVATRDDQLVVLHDICLDRVTDVSTRFPGRARENGRYYVRDFELAEIRQLKVREREDAKGKPVYPGRYAPRSGDFHVHTLTEELDCIAALNIDSGRNAGIYPEIKRPAWHREEGVDIALLMQKVLLDSPFAAPEAAVFVQCFDAAELRRLKAELGYHWALVQLLGENAWGESATDFDALRSVPGLTEVGRIAAAVGPWMQQLYTLDGFGTPVTTGLAERAHRVGLAVHAYTLRSDDLPPGFRTFDELVRFCAMDLALDGLFTDFPDKAGDSLRALPGPD
jgi:glycerophosphoryl diester phosphodiesterase